MMLLRASLPLLSTARALAPLRFGPSKPGSDRPRRDAGDAGDTSGRCRGRTDVVRVRAGYPVLCQLSIGAERVETGRLAQPGPIAISRLRSGIRLRSIGSAPGGVWRIIGEAHNGEARVEIRPIVDDVRKPVDRRVMPWRGSSSSRGHRGVRDARSVQRDRRSRWPAPRPGDQPVVEALMVSLEMV